MSTLISQFAPPSLSALWCPYVHSLRLSLYENRVICTIFPDSTWPVVIDYSILNEPTKCLKFLMPLDPSLVSQVETESIVKLSPKAFYPQILEIKSVLGAIQSCSYWCQELKKKFSVLRNLILVDPFPPETGPLCPPIRPCLGQSL